MLHLCYTVPYATAPFRITAALNAIFENSVVGGLWSVVSGRWPVVSGQWSVVSVIDSRSTIHDRRFPIHDPSPVFTTLTPKLSHFRGLARVNGTKSGLSQLDSMVYPVPFCRKSETAVGQTDCGFRIADCGLGLETWDLRPGALWLGTRRSSPPKRLTPSSISAPQASKLVNSRDKAVNRASAASSFCLRCPSRGDAWCCR